MPAINDFIASPKNFLWRGPLVIDDVIGGRLPANAQAQNLRFDITTTQHSPTHKSFTVEEVVQGGQLAFYLPWRNDQATWMQLDNTRSFFFTAELSGCIFVIERDTANGQPRVMHIGANLAGQKTALITQRMGAGVRTHCYESEQDGVATALGYRTAQGWVFHVQRRALGYQTVTIRPGMGPAGVRLGNWVDNTTPGQVRDVYTYKA